MSDGMVIQSHKGPYKVHFDEEALERLNAAIPEGAHFVIDSQVAQLYGERLRAVLAHHSVLSIDAVESNKSLDRFPTYVAHLVAQGLRRDHLLIAIGGGIIQDITCFLAATMLRGVKWRFYPTTLLAQCDSCIGSKSSINCGDAKNILGTFTPPNDVIIASTFLDTLDRRDVRSGIGEMLKVHAIAGPGDFANLANNYDRLFEDRPMMIETIRRSLRIKQSYIERDEFDTGSRLVFNFGHSFGHAIEAATSFAVPHGIAVSMGMDMANWVSWQLGIGTEEYFRACHGVLQKNYAGWETIEVPMHLFMTALSKDKKNIGSDCVTLILPDAEGRVFRGVHVSDGNFFATCTRYFNEVRQ